MENQRESCRVNAYLFVKEGVPEGEGANNSMPEPELFIPPGGRFIEAMRRGSIIEVSLSEKGIGFAGLTPHVINEDLEITVIFPKLDGYWCAVTAYGRVVWVGSGPAGIHRTGAEFTAMSEAARDDISGFIIANQKEKAKAVRFDDMHYEGLLGRTI
jgi:hypothetical protein